MSLPAPRIIYRHGMDASLNLAACLSRHNPGRDWVAKCNNYLAVGMPWYWLIDAESLVVQHTMSRLDVTCAPARRTPALCAPAECAECTEQGTDGLEDLTLKFSTQEVVQALGWVDDRTCHVLELTGTTTDDTPIVGHDVVRVQQGGKP